MGIYITGFIIIFITTTLTQLEDSTDIYNKPTFISYKTLIGTSLLFAVLWPLTLLIMIISILQELNKRKSLKPKKSSLNLIDRLKVWIMILTP